MRGILIFFMILFLSGCGLINFPKLNAPPAPDTTYQYEQTFERNPTAVVSGDKIVVVEAQKQTVTAGFVQKEKKLSWWQRFCNWLGNLGLIGIMLIVAGLFFAPAGTMSFLFARYGKFKKALQQTVAGIKESGAVDKDPTLKESLSSRQDSDTKMLIDDIRRGGVK